MSRANGPVTQPGGRQYPAAAEIDPQTGRPITAGGPPQRVPQGQPQPPPQYAQQPYGQPAGYAPGYDYGAAPGGYAQPQGYPQQAPQADPHQQPQYGQPQHYGAQQGYAEPSFEPAPPANAYGQTYGYQPDYQYQPQQPEPTLQVGNSAPAQPPASPATRGFAPQFDAYVPPSQGRQAPPAFSHEPQPAPPSEGLSRLSLSRGRQQAEPPSFAPPASDAYEHDAYGHGQWQQPAAQGYPQPGQAANHQQPAYGQAQHGGQPAFDTGGYHPHGFDQPSQGHAEHRAEHDVQFEQWPGQHAGHPGGQPAHGGFDAPAYQHASGGYGMPAGQPGQHFRADDGQGALAAGYEHHDDEVAEHDEVDETAPRKSGLLMVAAALATAVVVGGGLAYGYQKLMGKPGTEIATPVVKGSDTPAKSKPSDPGGKQFAHTDSKVMGRLSEGGSASGSEDPNAPRKVTTLVVGRDGSLTPPAPDAPPAAVPAALPTPTVSVPGMTLVDGFGGRQPIPVAAAAPPAPPAPVPAQPIAVVAPPAPPAKPIVVARTQPATATATDAGAEADIAPPPAPPARKVVPKKPVANDAYNPAGTTTTAALPTPAPAPRASSGGASGYVAVLASVPMSASSRMDALKRFADLQQKYASVLSDKTPDVQEANLGEKGNYHRLMVGPPGSREQASGLCSQLKAAGYADCWVKSY